MFNRYLRLATMNSHPPTGVPGSRQIWIEDERAIHKGRSVIQVSDHVRERLGTKLDREHQHTAHEPVSPRDCERAGAVLALISEPPGSHVARRFWGDPALRKWNLMELFDLNDKHILITPSYPRTMSYLK